jgi:hypothetical protein
MAVIVKRRQNAVDVDRTFIIEVSDHSGRKFSLDALQQNVYFTRSMVVGLKGGCHACPELLVPGRSIVPWEPVYFAQ